MAIDPSQVVQFATKGVFQMLTEQVKGIALGKWVPQATDDEDSDTSTLREYAELPELDDDTELGDSLLGDRAADRVEEHKASLPEDLFANVVGLDDEKAVLRACYVAPTPLHAVLVGPPGGAKSVMLDELSRAPDTLYIVGGNTTPAGLIAILEPDSRPHVVLIDEIEKSSREFQDSLLSAMSGKLVVAKHAQSSNIDIDTRFIGAANSIMGISAPLRDRMVELHLQPYTEPQRHEIIEKFLVQRRGMPAASATAVADMVAPYSASVRDAEQIAVIYNQDPELAKRRAEALRSTPVETLPHRQRAISSAQSQAPVTHSVSRGSLHAKRSAPKSTIVIARS